MQVSLEEYRKKRDFEETSEPSGKLGVADGKTYVIQKHQAQHLHYDLRLELNGVLKSWAIPKTPPVEAGVKRLAVQVEDHPVEYAAFKGRIPEGSYGTGNVEIWDKGEYDLIELGEDKLVFQIRGSRLRGTYCLIRFKARKNWLFFKKR